MNTNKIDCQEESNGEQLHRKILREQSLLEPIIKNPFVYKLKLSLKDKVLFGMTGIILVPIRLVSMLILLLIASLTAYVVTFGYSDKELQSKPLTGWRTKFRGFFRFFGRAIAFCAGFHHIKKIGKRATHSEATIFVAAPHTSFFDAFVFFVLGLPIGVSRSENAKIPLVGHIVRYVQLILVSRSDSKNKLFTIDEIKRRTNPANKWPQLLIFPEGTTTNGSCLITFKPGGFIPARPVQPVVVEYKNKINTAIWTWEGPTALQNIFLTLCRFNNKLQITYLPVYYPNEKERENPRLFADNVRKIMADHLNVLTTNHTYDDCRLMLKARELNLPFESGLIEFDKIKEKLNINYENAQEILKKFTTHARKSDGKMSLKDFSDYLGLPINEPVRRVFQMYDRGNDGFIDFREFLIGLSLLSQPANTEETLKLAFNMFDTEDKGFITLNNLKSILYSAFAMSGDKVTEMFQKIDTKNDAVISYDELKAFASQRPEYAQIFLVYNEIKILRNNVEIEKMASIKSSSSVTDSNDDVEHDVETSSMPQNEVTMSPSGTILHKRPTSDRTRQPIGTLDSRLSESALEKHTDRFMENDNEKKNDTNNKSNNDANDDEENAKIK